MIKLIKQLVASTALATTILIPSAFAVSADLDSQPINFLEPAINTDDQIEVKKSTIFDASPSFLPEPEADTTYIWDFGDGNKNEGVEVLHAYKEPGDYTIKLTIKNDDLEKTIEKDIFVYNKLILLITDQDEARERIILNQTFAEQNGVYIKTIDSFGSTTEFISEEVLAKKLQENANNIEKASDIVSWTKENAGLNALSRFIQNNKEQKENILSQKNILILDNNFKSKINRIERQFELIQPKQIIAAQEGALNALTTTTNIEEFQNTLEDRGQPFKVVTAQSSKIRPWNFMQYFVSILINNGIPDNTIALLLLLPVIATVIAFMRQVVGITTFGIYTPSIITLSFLVIGLSAGIITLFTAIIVGSLTRPALKRLRILFIPKMAMVISLVSIVLLFILIFSIYLNLFDATFLSIAIFPMLILSTLVEKFVSAKSDKSLWSAAFLMGETVVVSIVAYFVAGGEINLGVGVIKFEFVKNLMLTYPETILLLLVINFGLGKWTGLRVLERVRFREILRHIEE